MIDILWACSIDKYSLVGETSISLFNWITLMHAVMENQHITYNNVAAVFMV